VATSTEAIDAALAESAPAENVVNENLVPIEKPAPPKAAPKPPEKKKGRAVALKGCEIAGQDGEYARYRKICTVCHHKDSACHTIVISSRVTKGNYFCPKCRKRRDVVIQCHLK